MNQKLERLIEIHNAKAKSVNQSPSGMAGSQQEFAAFQSALAVARYQNSLDDMPIALLPKKKYRETNPFKKIR